MKLSRLRTMLVTGALVTALVCTTLGTGFALADPGADNISDAIVTALPIVGVAGSLDATSTDVRDVYQIELAQGQTLDASMTVTSAATLDTDFDLSLYQKTRTSSIDETRSETMAWGTGKRYEHFTFMAAEKGTYYLDVHAFKGAGTYLLDARIRPAVAFKIGYLSLPKSAKKGKYVKVSAVVTPAYNGYYSPVYMYFYRYEGGKYRRKAIKNAWGGVRNGNAANSKISTTYKFTKKGKWRVKAEFWDEAHKSKFTSYKYITIK